MNQNQINYETSDDFNDQFDDMNYYNFDLDGKFIFSTNAEDAVNYMPNFGQNFLLFVSVGFDGANLPLSSQNLFLGFTTESSMNTWINAAANSLINNMDAVLINDVAEIHYLTVELVFANFSCDLSGVIIADTRDPYDILVNILTKECMANMGAIMESLPCAERDLIEYADPLVGFISDVASILRINMDVNCATEGYSAAEYLSHQIGIIFPVDFV